MPLQLPCVPELEKSCCCCPLKVGAGILGWLSMIGSTFMSVMLIIGIANLYTVAENTDGRSLLNLDGNEDISNEMKEFITILVEKGLIIILVLSLIGVLFNVLLLCGIHGEKPALMLPYILSGLFGLVSELLIKIYIGIFISTVNIGVGLLTLFFSLLVYGLVAYFWTIIYSHYRELERSRNESIPYEKHSNQLNHYFANT